MPHLQVAIDPKEIVDKFLLDEKEKAPTTTSTTDDTVASNNMPGHGNNQIGLVHAAIADNRVQLPNNGAWEMPI